MTRGQAGGRLPLTSYTHPARRDARARRIERALHVLATAMLVLVLTGATLQAARLALGTSALQTVLDQAEALRGF